MPVLEKRREVEGQGVSDLYLHPTAAATLKPSNRFVYADTSDGAMALALPPPESCPGVEIFIKLVTDGGDLTVTNVAAGTITINDADEWTLVKSVGKLWIEVVNNLD